MMTTRNEELRTHKNGIEGMLTLSDEEMREVTGGETIYNAYYDVTNGRYVLVPEGQVYAGSGLLVGQARLNS